jgi:hypothetical protein
MMGMNIIVVVCLIGLIGTVLLNPPKIYASANKDSELERQKANA